ncbi:hypothetical protein L226DRAFT_613380 [Lentinus tigrinus ALCF2SS1-7]|uniref:Uncharacterized protein n=1 Tax=Lentinus tigrinus ALCF2SS1-6 TaxID=1328759 RepID=A0A5C2SE80_9APHY|nr:hypothetical protein L227DRAFT_652198 [Lentinus tigrinus ALCF2SS1-6]RPD74546.1 hypothetical protein L226DRAFT_613380 [Lentinus tigrinus ALCF2SS1-7]
MSADTQPPSKTEKVFDIYISGYALTLDMISRLCLLKYNAPPAVLKNMGPLDTACYYFQRCKAIDAPTLVHTYCKDQAQGGKVVERWILPGKVAFFQPGNPPTLSYDDETRAYLNTWLPPDLLQTEEFKDIRFLCMHWPRGERPTGIVLHAIRMLNKDYRERHQKAQQIYLVRRRKHGITAPLPPSFPVEWLV